MYFSEKILLRLKLAYLGVAMGIAIWLLYASYLVLSNAISTHTSFGGVELVLTPILSLKK